MGGFGSIIVEVTAVAPNGRISVGDLGLYNNEQEKKLAELVKSIHAPYYPGGVKIGIQLGHSGRKASSGKPWISPGHVFPEKGGVKGAVSCSPIPFRDGETVPKELTIEGIKEVQKQFVDSAERAKRAGFDFIEIHGAHGYLINQFLTSGTNKRKDKYGGSFENRCRFLLEILDMIVERIGEEYPIFVRLSCDEQKRVVKGDEETKKLIEEANKNRWDSKQTVKLVKLLKEHGVCFIDCSSSSVQRDQDWSGLNYPLWQVKYSEDIKKAYGDTIKTSAVGIISKANECNDIIKNKQSDIVQLGRAALINPYTPIFHAKELGFTDDELLNLYVPQHSYAIKRLWVRENQRLEKLKQEEKK